MQRQTLNLKEAADLLNISYHTAQGMAKSGELPGAKIGRAWVFIYDDLIEWLRQQVESQRQERLQPSRTPILRQDNQSASNPPPLPKAPGQIRAA